MRTIFCLLISLSLIACTVKEEPPAESGNKAAALELPQSSAYNLPGEALTVFLPVSGSEVSLSADQSWASHNASASYEGRAALALQANTGIAPRSCQVTVKQGGATSVCTVIQYGKHDLTIGQDPTDPSKALTFPGAQGAGSITTGGRGGAVYHVTNLSDNNSKGSLRWAINQSGPRTIVFDVSGIINLNSMLDFPHGNVTIAGQTAPGDGICLKNYGITMNKVDNVCIRFLRIRPGDEKGKELDAIWVRFKQKFMIDHCSMSWTIDESCSLYDNMYCTVQWCYITESLRKSVHAKDAHGYGGVFGGQPASYHHNLFAHHDSRNPRMSGKGNAISQFNQITDYRNNVTFNWGGNSCYGGEGDVKFNFINNYYRPGPATRAGEVSQRIFQPGPDSKDASWASIFLSGNYFTDVNGKPNTTVNNDNWAGIHPNPSSKNKNELKASSAFPCAFVTTHSAQTAYERVLTYGGTSLVRDNYDKRIVSEVRSGKPTYMTGSNGSKNGLIDKHTDVGGWETYEGYPALPDSDSDGIPDVWEVAYGLNPNEAADGKTKTLDNLERYTNVEVYLHNLVQHIVSEQNK